MKNLLISILSAIALLAGAPMATAAEHLDLGVIVKFKDQSEPGEIATRVLQDAPTMPANLDKLADTLSEELGVPVVIERVTSGREFLIQLDMATLQAQLEKRLRDRDDVEYVETNRMLQPMPRQ